MKDAICVLPWIHLNFDPDGSVYPCCLTAHHQKPVGNLHSQPLEKIWNGDRMKDLRLSMLANQPPKICSVCFDRERATGHSKRLQHNTEFKEVLSDIPNITNSDGSCNTMKLRYWDFRFNNTCNFKCRSCGPSLSSSWVADAKSLGWDVKQDKVWSIKQVNDDSTFNFIEDNIDIVEKIYFAGGEPLLMEEHWFILELLERKNRFDVEIFYNTNLSTLIHRKKNILEIWKKWNPNKIEVSASIDEIGTRAEMIRHGTLWSKIESNIKDVAQLGNVLIKPSITVSVFNVSRIVEILEYFIEIGIINNSTNYRNFHLNVLQVPEHYQVGILSDDHKRKLISKIKEFTLKFRMQHRSDLRTHFDYLIDQLSVPQDISKVSRFLEITKRLDDLRNEDTFGTIPEIAYLKN